MPDANVVRLIREQANIVDIVSAYVRLQPSGKSYRALCPFHQEKTPSFYVSPDKGFWHCFGCGLGGDVIDFVQRIEGLTFPEAIAKLARLLGIRWRPSPTLRREEWMRERLLQLNQWAVDFFERALWTSEVGERGKALPLPASSQHQHGTAVPLRLRSIWLGQLGKSSTGGRLSSR